MQIGGFYRLGNILWRTDKMSNAEGKMNEAQIERLDPSAKDATLVAIKK